MDRNCDVCGTGYTAKRATSRYCSQACRVRSTRLRAAGVEVHSSDGPKDPAPSTEAPRVQPPAPSLVAMTIEQLETAGRLNSFLGQQALILATRLELGGSDTGASLASVSKELRAVMTEALDGVAVAEDPVDELKRRREAKRVG